MEKLCMHELRNWEKSKIEGERVTVAAALDANGTREFSFDWLDKNKNMKFIEFACVFVSSTRRLSRPDYV